MRGAYRATSIQNLDSKQTCLLRNAISPAPNCARNMGAVTISIAILAVFGEVLQPCRTFPKVSKSRSSKYQAMQFTYGPQTQDDQQRYPCR